MSADAYVAELESIVEDFLSAAKYEPGRVFNAWNLPELTRARLRAERLASDEEWNLVY